MTAGSPADSVSRGKRAESLARNFLRDNGLSTLEKNYRCRHGELDLVMRDGSTIVFVEVRYRESGGYGSGAETVTSTKQRHLIAAARHYLQHTQSIEDPPCRFDILAISRNLETPEIEWIKDAFDA